MGIKRVKYEDIKKQKGRTVKEDLDGMQDVDITECVINDLDLPVSTEAELNEFERVGCKNMSREEVMSKKSGLIKLKSDMSKQHINMTFKRCK